MATQVGIGLKYAIVAHDHEARVPRNKEGLQIAIRSTR
jgi:hypothetical protein